MLWYGGSIAEAVTLSKQRNAIFVVFVEGENELSLEMSQTLNDAAIAKRLSNESNFLVIKLTSGSSNYTHFAQIYQFVPVPSLFFIGRNGTPLEVVCAGVEANNLATRIDRILNEHLREKEPASSAAPSLQPSTSAQSIKEQTLNLIQSEAKIQDSGKHSATDEPETSGPASKVLKTEHHEVTKSGVEYEVVCNDDVCVRVPKNKADEPGPSREVTVATAEVTTTKAPAEVESVASMEERMEKTKELIEMRRREKVEKEKEAEKQKEIERRSIGKGVAELKRWQAENEFKLIQEERRREKKQNDEARQRILAQIAQDRAERKARDAPAPAATAATPATPATTPTLEQPLTSGDAAPARVQFKLPDGTSHTHNFDADSALGDVRRYVADTFQMSISSFSLWTAFPRRELVETDATLRELNLAPSAALLVLRRQGAADVVARPNTSVASIITFLTHLFTTFILEPASYAYNWVLARFSAAAPRSPPAAPAPPGAPPAPRPPTRRRGNVHRLTGDRGTDDDNNTWNGNSTQQM